MSAGTHDKALASLLGLAAAVLATCPVRAAEPEALDEEFLEYLSQLEDEQDDWTLFDASEDEPTAAKPAAPPSAPSQQATTSPTKVAPPKVAKEVKR